ncbi:MAG: hypothetical protein U1E05_13800, partial [Patescibacteria group bacterium]|nr:hypothetical protein [Patescibacteria group bacterium]
MVLNVVCPQSHHLPSKPTRVCAAMLRQMLWLLAGPTACTLLASHFFPSTAWADHAVPKGATWVTPEAVVVASGPGCCTQVRVATKATVRACPAGPMVSQRQEGPFRKLSGPLGTQIDRLCKAIDALHVRYHDDYPDAAAYVDRLRQIEDRLLDGTGDDDHRAETELAELRRDALLAHPLLRGQPIVFVVRQQYMPDHHNTGTMFQPGEINAGSFRGGGAIKTIDVGRGGKATTLLELADGVARDLEVHFDGQTLLFAMRRSAAEPYAIHEMAADGTNRRQLTHPAGATDIDPCYLPDGRIVFASTRDGKFCGCNRHIQANLFVMDANGANVRQIGRNNLFESRPSMLSDGRILYDRWEYVDRHFGPSFGLWTVRPDGTNHALYFGNNAWAPGAIFDAREIPGTQQVVAILSSCHDRPWGAMVVLDRRLALDGMEAVLHCWPPDRADLAARMSNPTDVPDKPSPGHPHEPLIDTFRSMPVKYEDPYPLDEAFFLCSRMTGEGEQTGIYLVDVFGNELLLHAEAPGCFDPMPLGPRPRPPLLPESQAPTNHA